MTMSADGAKMTAGNGSEWQALAMLNDIGPGQMMAREVGDIHLALYNIGGEIFAADNVCTHAYALLTDGWFDGNIIECPLHGGQFDVCTGKAVSNPVEVDLRTYSVRVIEGRIEVLLPR
jgi:nitrite reductase/ring-hydroxylating ferredoxin subunit